MNKIILAIIFIFCISCKNKTNSETEVYYNDFENNSLSGISGGITSRFNNSAVLGRYNNGAFSLTINNLPKHDLITITFDLYIHDNWRGQLPPDGADIWEMMVDNELYINTTFSNLECKPGNFCPPQSYPANYPNSNNNPRAGAFRTDLPGVCSMISAPNGTSLYKIKKTFTHNSQSLVLKCLDKLNQSNYPDPKCEKSWSVDNINIKATTL